MAALPPHQFGRLLQTLEIGVASNDREALLSSLEAVASLGRHDYELRRGGHPGVQAAGAGAGFPLLGSQRGGLGCMLQLPWGRRLRETPLGMAVLLGRCRTAWGRCPWEA